MLTQHSKYLENAVNELAKLPGVGRRTALRLALHIAKADNIEIELLTNAIIQLKRELKECKICYNLSDAEVCEICSNHKRDASIICVVQDIRDVIAIESTQQFNGIYHVLGGIISPVDGVGPQQLRLSELFIRVAENPVEEVVLALAATTEGDTTNFYIYKNIKDKVKTVTTLARGVGIGEELEFTDKVTLGRSLLARTDFEMQYGRRNSEV